MADVTAAWSQANMAESQVAGAVALITDVPVDDVFGYVIVAVFNQGGRPTGMKMVSSFGTDRGAASQVLRHAAAHLTGRCRRCRLLAKARGRESR